MNLLGRLTRSPAPARRGGLVELATSFGGSSERLPNDFKNYVAEGYRANGVVFAVILARLLLFSEARFKYRSLTTKELYGDANLTLLERPWPNGTTGELLARMEQDGSLAGNAYVYRAAPDRLQRLRPDWVEIILNEARTELYGYIYTPGGAEPNRRGRLILPEEMCHWSPIPDPEANFRGMSWLTPVVREVNADSLMTRHKGKFFENAATPNLLLKVEKKLEPAQRARLEEAFAQRYEGWDNAYKTFIVEGGADLTAIGHSFEQMNFSTVQAAGENRIATAGGVPGIVVGLKEGLQAATYSNYAQALRRFADLTMRPNWRSVSAALSVLVPVPAGSELWYDDRDIPALKQDAKDAAEIAEIKANTAAILIRAGYSPADVGRYVEAGVGLDRLTHTGGIPNPLYPPDPKVGGKPAAASGA